jgi:iron complex outermembrane receptor protein
MHIDNLREKVMKKILLLVLLVFGSFSFAQEESSENIEEVVTTAFRSEDQLQDTALAVSVVTPEDIESKNLKEFADFQYSVPGLTFVKSNFSAASVSIRGLTGYCVGGSCAGITTFRVDDVNQGSLQMAFNELYDIQTFEVLRGPQGTLFGGNNPAGTFIINSVDPGDDADAYIEYQTGDLNLSRVTGAMTINPGEDFRTRISFRAVNRDGYVDNLYNNTKIDDRNLFGARIKSIWDVSDDTSLKLTMMVANEEDSRFRTGQSHCNTNALMGCEQWGDELPDRGVRHSGVSLFANVDWITMNYPGDLVQSNILLDTDVGVALPVPYESTNVQFNPKQIRDDYSASLVLDHTLNDNWDVSFISFFNMQEYFHAQDLNGTVPTLPYRMGNVNANVMGSGMRTFDRDMAVDNSEFNYRENTYELRFTSNLDGPFNLQAGLYHSLYRYFTNYKVETPGLHYYSEVGLGPIGRMYPELAGFGGLPFWSTFLLTYAGVAEDNITNAVVGAAAGYVAADPTTPAQITALSAQYLALGLCSGPIDCAALAQMFLIGQAAEIPSVRLAGTQAGVQTSLDTARNAIMAAAAAGQMTPQLPMWQRNVGQYDKGFRTTDAVYAEGTFDLNDKTMLRAGVRFNSFDIDQYVFSGLTDVGPGGLLAGYNGTLSGFPVVPGRSASDEEVTGRLILDYKLDNGNLLYAKYDRGVKSGGFNPTAVDGITSFDPELHSVFEVGSKNTFLGGALVVNAAAYLNDIDGLQSVRIEGFSSTTYNIDAQIMGLELESLFIPAEWVRIALVAGYNVSEIGDGVSEYDPTNPYNVSAVLSPSVDGGFGVSFAQTDVGLLFRSFGDYCQAPFNALLGVPCVDNGKFFVDLSGNRLPQVPETTAQLSTEFDLVNNDDGLLTFNVDYIYRGDFYLTPFNNEFQRIPEFSFVNAGLRFDSSDGRWGLDVYLHNLEDKDVPMGGFPSTGANGGNINVYYMEPMNGGISLRYNF